MYKKIFLTLILAILINLQYYICFSSEIHDKQLFNDWHSYLLTNNDNSTVIQIATFNKENDTNFLIIQMTPGDCNSYILKSVTMDKNFKDEGVLDIPGAIRIDKRNIYDINVKAVAEKGCLTKYIKFKGHNNFIDDCINGDYLRIQYKLGDQFIYEKFSLNGFTNAFNRCKWFCNNLVPKKNKSNDEDFFKSKRGNNNSEQVDNL